MSISPTLPHQENSSDWQQEYPLTGIHESHDHDVLCGRGNHINFSPGNKFFRALIRAVKFEYVATPKGKKAEFADLVVRAIRNLNPPGRFLAKRKITTDNTSSRSDQTASSTRSANAARTCAAADSTEPAFVFDDIGDTKALEKTRQALRENAPEIEEKIKEGVICPRQLPAKELIEIESKKIYKEQFSAPITTRRGQASTASISTYNDKYHINGNFYQACHGDRIPARYQCRSNGGRRRTIVQENNDFGNDDIRGADHNIDNLERTASDNKGSAQQQHENLEPIPLEEIEYFKYPSSNFWRSLEEK